ncbi:stabilizer of axonemal microtubules 5-like [Clavelina lepadiformis]|uniref:Uncharacterized protein n=1 Tax=Clavelina lepadiformis TaxID=159417 RepID=A0ABP0H010_CLALP
MIPTPLKGQDFLASSHYKISHDERFIPDTLKSTFHKDYVPPQSNLKIEALLPPKPSEFMHQDLTKIDSNVSETREAYPPKETIHDDTRDKYSSLYKTNFKMNSDSRIDVFSTSHDEYFKPIPTAPTDVSKLGKVWMKSSLPQGDKEKADEPISNYRQSFLGHDMKTHKAKHVESQHRSGKSTITGDSLRRFNTTHDSAFTGMHVDPAKPVPKHTVSSIPEGDKEQVVENTTIMKQSYQPSFLTYESQDSFKAYKQLYATNYKMKDIHGTFDKYLSTQAESYKPISQSSREKRNRDRNASDIPEGDLDPFRAHERTSSTVARSHHKPLDLRRARVPRVNGSQLRTFSNVQLGAKEHASNFYSTTCDSTYKAVSVPWVRADSYPITNVPLKYYGDEKTSPTTWSDFPAHDMAKFQPHEAAHNSLRTTHFLPPLGDERYFSTSHNSHYTPKQIEKLAVDLGRLQRSSVPIGTMGKFIQGCYNG